MTGFSSTWLEAREPWDHAARAPAVTDAALAWLAARRTDAPLRIIDLGCGAGSNLAFLAPRIAGAQHWTLVDDDPALLAEAAGRAARLAGVTTTPRGADLAAGDLPALLGGADLVACAALLPGCALLLAAAPADAQNTWGITPTR